MDLKEYIRSIPDYPKKGILFRDITTLIKDEKAFEECINQIVENSVRYNNFIRLDMENHKTTENNIKTFKKISKENNNIGIVFQAYLHRTYNDIKKLEDGSNIRLCKGIYVEPKDIVINEPEKINENFLKLLKLAFSKKIFVGIATHDEILIEKCCQLINCVRKCRKTITISSYPLWIPIFTQKMPYLF